jgi:hypothetical protein
MPNELEIAIMVLQKQKLAHENKVAEKMTGIVKQLREIDSNVIAR